MTVQTSTPKIYYTRLLDAPTNRFVLALMQGVVREFMSDRGAAGNTPDYDQYLPTNVEMVLSIYNLLMELELGPIEEFQVAARELSPKWAYVSQQLPSIVKESRTPSSQTFRLAKRELLEHIF